MNIKYWTLCCMW